MFFADLSWFKPIWIYYTG